MAVRRRSRLRPCPDDRAGGPGFRDPVADRHRYPTATNQHAGAGADTQLDANPSQLADEHLDTTDLSNSHADGYGRSGLDRDAAARTDTHGDLGPHAHADQHSHRDFLAHPDADVHADQNAHPDAHAHAGIDAHADTDAHANQDVHAGTDANANESVHGAKHADDPPPHTDADNRLGLPADTYPDGDGRLPVVAMAEVVGGPAEPW